MENIDRFNEWSALVLAWLYEKFPVPTSLHHGDLKSSPDARSAEKFFRHTVVFLAEEGYLRYAELKAPAQFSSVTLTRKGLNSLNRQPDPKNDARSLGEKLVQNVHSGARGPFNELVELFLDDADIVE